MTQLLEKAYARVSNLSNSQQDSIAAIILEELEDDACWDAKFASTQDLLGRMSDVAMDEHRAGKTLPLDADLL